MFRGHFWCFFLHIWQNIKVYRRVYCMWFQLLCQSALINILHFHKYFVKFIWKAKISGDKKYQIFIFEKNYHWWCFFLWKPICLGDTKIVSLGHFKISYFLLNINIWQHKTPSKLSNLVYGCICTFLNTKNPFFLGKPICSGNTKKCPRDIS